MNIKTIFTTRHIQQDFFWQIVWEWEDAIASQLHLSVAEVKPYLFGSKSSKLDRLIFRPSVFPITRLLLGESDLPSIMFHINPPWVNGFHNQQNVIPIVVDCWRNDIVRMPKMFRNQKAIFMCNLEAVNILRASAPSLPIHYLPISIPESYIPTEIPKKDIDILCYGRTHPDLVRWAHDFVSKHPEVRFCWIESHEGRPFLYEAGKKIELESSRKSLMKLISRSRIVLQSSPGMHSKEIERTGGLNPVTPRFFEAASMCCHMVGIYPNNDEFKKICISDICKNVNTYSEFYEAVKFFLREPFGINELNRNQAFLRYNATERRADEIRSVLHST